MRQHADADAGARNALALQLPLGIIGERRSQGFRGSQAIRIERAQDRATPRRLQLGKPHPVGRQHAGQRVQQHAANAERVGDEAGMLATCAAEGIHHVVGDVVAALHRDTQDRVRHVLDRDADEAVGHLRSLAAIADLGGKRGEAFAHDLGVERLVLRRAEDLGEERRHELPNHHIGVGDGERSAAAIAGRSRIGAGGIGADAEARAIIDEDRTAARRYGMDQHHRRAHAHAGDHALEGPLVHAVEMADIGRRAAHVEADDAGEACDACRLHRADHAACRTGEDGVLAFEQMRRREPARGLHEQKLRVCYGSGSSSPSPLWGEGRGEGAHSSRSAPPHPAAPRVEQPTSPR